MMTNVFICFKGAEEIRIGDGIVVIKEMMTYVYRYI